MLNKVFLFSAGSPDPVFLVRLQDVLHFWNGRVCAYYWETFFNIWSPLRPSLTLIKYKRKLKCQNKTQNLQMFNMTSSPNMFDSRVAESMMAAVCLGKILLWSFLLLGRPKKKKKKNSISHSWVVGLWEPPVWVLGSKLWFSQLRNKHS